MIFYSVKEKIIFYNIPVILFSFLPLFLITGPFLPDFTISLIGILFLIYCIKRKNFFFFKNKYFYFFLIFWFYLILNNLINNFNIDSLKISLFYFRYGVFVIAIVAFLYFENRFIKYFFYCIFGCFLILILDGFYQYFVGENLFGYKTQNNYRISSFFRDEFILGSYLSRIWPLFLGLFIIIIEKKNKLFILFLFTFILSEVLIFLSGDRSSFFYINLSAFFVIFFSSKLYKIRLFTLFSSFILIILISLINPTAKERLVDKTLNQMNLNSNSLEKGSHEKIYIFSKQHTHHYITAFKMFLDNKVLGVGIKNFRKFCNDKKYEISKLSCSTHPHNTYVQILVEIGIIGFLFLIFIFFYYLKYVFKHFLLKIKGKIYFNDFEICLLSGILIYIWPIVPTGNFFNNWININLIIYLPFLIWSRNLAKIRKF